MSAPTQWPVPVVLDWPRPQLWPNARVHWAAKARAVAKARGDAGWMTRAAGLGGCATGAHRLCMRVTFHPPDRRRRDRDNLVAALKAAMDGVADAIGCDDARFVPTYEIGEPAPPHGCVLVSIHQPERGSA